MVSDFHHIAPKVSVIVPARNEEECLGACLESLAGQERIGFEVIVVDDGSTDRTKDVATTFGVTVIEAGELPAGWGGKCHAVWTGAQHARGEWLLFTDADTVHKPGSLARAVVEAEDFGAELLSYSPAQEVEGFWERALMPVVFAELAATYRPSEVSDPNSPTAAANGQYLLIRKTTYEAVGGHRAVRGSLLEDVELAKRVKQSGRRIRFRFGGDAVRTRMYRTLPQMREGWTKNLALLFPDASGLAGKRALEFAAMAGGLAAAVFGKRKVAAGGALVAGVAYASFLRRIRRAHFDPLSTALAPLGLPMFAWLLYESARVHRQGTVEWKGRVYGGGK